MTPPVIGNHRASQGLTGSTLPSASSGASLTEDGTANAVQFTINPTQMELQHSATTAQRQALSKRPGANQAQMMLTADAAIQDLGETTLVLSGLIFNGADVAKTCKQFFDWSNPTTTGIANPALPKLSFSWGPLTYDVFLTSANITYERFTPSGKPIRAKVSLKFIVTPPLPIPTNPTSGGIQGRRSHTLVAGENLQHIAMANYGRPGAWRALAAANGIEDPLAVRPGTVIYVPASTELAELAGGSAG